MFSLKTRAGWTAQASAPRNRDGVVVASGLNLIAMELQLRPWPTISLWVQYREFLERLSTHVESGSSCYIHDRRTVERADCRNRSEKKKKGKRNLLRKMGYVNSFILGRKCGKVLLCYFPWYRQIYLTL